MESISGEQLKEDVTALLRRCTGDPSLRAPVRVVRSKWVTDPLYLGAYSYGAIDSEFPQNQVRLHIIPHKRSNSQTFSLFLPAAEQVYKSLFSSIIIIIIVHPSPLTLTLNPCPQKG